MSPAELDKLVPEISISKYLQAQAPPGEVIREVSVAFMEYFRNLSSIIKSSDRQTLHDFFQWGLVRAWIDAIDKDFGVPLRRFKNLMAGKGSNATTERWRTCLLEVDSDLGWIESGVYIQLAFSREAKEFGERIIVDIKQLFMQKLQTPDWMSDSVKAAALNKGEPATFVVQP